MKAIILDKTGGPEVLSIKEIPAPSIQPGEVKIKVKAFGLNKMESYRRQGKVTPPNATQILGIEATGEIIEDPTGKFQVGQKVVTMMGGMGMARPGSYAEFITIPSQHVLAIDSDISFEELAAIPEAFGTIGLALDKALNIKAGESILIKGATSGVGTAAVQYAKLKGLQVIATTRDISKTARLKELGADHVIVDQNNIHEEVLKIQPNGVDKALDVIGGDRMFETVAAVKAFGEVIVIGLLGGPPVFENLNIMTQLGKSVKIGFTSSGMLGTPAAPLEDTPIRMIAEQVALGNLQSLRVATFSFEQIAEAHQLLDSGKANGKIVVTL
ncbi:zinc-binding dehydrogenase [Sphingobacterium detergens]|uniref:NADPH2:quinone reductase n=1 Tax=Sphingobacterium detergens TaxID=1145106 RepID=A0A420BK58_SPHD1|nr:zinc-binding dehydrogenase [Sphingobacterium detergens]RKE57089.1 NADPH2:quinone reductase [Sphingobacterium detergens]